MVIRANAQSNSVSTDSIENKNINVYNPSSVGEQSIQIADPLSTQSTLKQTSNSNTETIRLYSGNQEGNNIIRTIEVPLPQSK